jgi:hypothetical protein
VRRPAPALPLPAREHQLERPADGGRRDAAVDERERLRGRQGGGGGGEDRVAGLRRGRRVGRARLGEDPRPGRVAVGLPQVEAAHAGRAAGQHERADHPDRLLGADHQVRHPVPHQRGDQHRVGPAGDHREVGRAAGVVGGAHLGRDPVHRAGRPAAPGRADVGGAQARGGDVRRFRRGAVQAAHPGDPGRGQEGRRAGAHPARAVDAGERRPPPGQHRRAAVGEAVRERRARHLGAEPSAQVGGQGGARLRGEVVEHARRGEQPGDPVHVPLGDAEVPGGARHRGHVPGPVEQVHHAQRLAEVGVQGPGAARVDADLERFPVPPQRP